MADDKYVDYLRDPAGLVGQLSMGEDIDINEMLEWFEQRQKERLIPELKRIEQQLEGRDGVHDEITSELEWKVEW